MAILEGFHLIPTTIHNNLFSSVVVLISAFLFSFTYLLRRQREEPVKDSLVLGNPGDADFKAALSDGYKRFKDKTFTIPTAHHSIVIIPHKFLDEFKNLPEEVLTFKEQVSARFLSRYTGLGINDTLVHSVKYDLTKNIPSILDMLQDEVKYAVETHIGDAPDWKPLPLYHMLSHLVALLSSRVFVGYPLNRDETWLRATLGYTLDGFTGSDKLWQYPKFLHPLVHYFIPEIRAVHKYLADGAKLIEPSMQKRREAMKRGEKVPSDMIQWIINNSDGKNKTNTAFVTKTQMLISVVAIHTTTMTMAQAVYDLVVHPEYIQPLRDEVKAIQATDGETWTKAGIAKLVKMDSFLKESQRFRPPGLVTMTRKFKKDFTLSNGITLPAGTFIGVAAQANALDEKYFDNPEKFDGFRFEKLRAKPGNDSKFQFVTTNNDDQLHWGVGKHACPGRFFASYEIKMLLAEILQKYDLQLPPGVTERPPDIGRDIRCVPNPMAQIVFKNRKTM